MGRERLDALLQNQYIQYRQRMQYLTWYFGWDEKYYPPQIIRPWGRTHYGQIR